MKDVDPAARPRLRQRRERGDGEIAVILLLILCMFPIVTVIVTAAQTADRNRPRTLAELGITNASTVSIAPKTFPELGQALGYLATCSIDIDNMSDSDHTVTLRGANLQYLHNGEWLDSSPTWLPQQLVRAHTHLIKKLPVDWVSGTQNGHDDLLNTAADYKTVRLAGPVLTIENIDGYAINP